MTSFNSVVDEDRWYAVQSQPHREFGAAKQLEFQGFRAFLPTHWKTVRHARRFRTKKAPFFPRYFFVRMNLACERWRSINGTFGVAGLVMAASLPMPVPHGVVEALDAMTGEDGVLAFKSDMEPGQKVRILTGPFADCVGEFLRADDRNRAEILLEVMGVQRVLRAPQEGLAPLA